MCASSGITLPKIARQVNKRFQEKLHETPALSEL
jgi:hypothetical protein